MLFSLWALAALPAVLAAPSHALSKTPSISKRCVNSASDRSCWGDYDINTDYYETVPDTGVTREYWLTVENMYVLTQIHTLPQLHTVSRQTELTTTTALLLPMASSVLSLPSTAPSLVPLSLLTGVTT